MQKCTTARPSKPGPHLSSIIYDFGWAHSYIDLASCTEHGSTLVFCMHLGVARFSEPKMTTAPLLKVPAEIRIIIYRLLLSDHKDMFLHIRTEEPSTYEQRKRQTRRRSNFRYIADRMRSRSGESTYYLDGSPGDIHTSILGVNQQIHDEASHVLYSEHTFEFGTHIECILPFMQDLTPAALSSIQRLSIVKRSLPYTKDFDRCEWRNACAFISQNLRLVQLDLYVEGGTPSLANKPALFWKQNSTYSKADFALIARLEEMDEDMEWTKHVVAIKDLQVLNVRALLQHCPIPSSKAMAFFVNFSASIETGFAEHLRSLMVTQS